MFENRSHSCTTCGCRAGVDELFLRWRGGYLCPRCFTRTERRHQTGVFVRDLALFIVAFNLILPAVWARVWPIAASNLLLAGFICLAVILHELAHAASAWLTGGKVFEIRVGGGPKLAQWRVRDLLLTVGWLPGTGFCAVEFPTGERIFRRTAVLTVAGMAANLLTILLALPGFDAQRLQAPPLAVRETIVIGSLVALISSLWPAQRAVGGMLQSSNGLELLRLLLGKRRPDLLHLGYLRAGGCLCNAPPRHRLRRGLVPARTGRLPRQRPPAEQPRRGPIGVGTSC